MTATDTNIAPDGPQCLDLSFNAPHIDAIHDLTLVGRLTTHKSINNEAIIAVLATAWNLGPNIQITPPDTKTVSCTFKYAKDRDKITEVGPWAVKGAILNLKRWPPNRTIEEIDFSLCPLWVQIHNLPPIGQILKISQKSEIS